eukprot:Lankesteria_metandrocarpae@DN6126_c0_g1_i1.p1
MALMSESERREYVKAQVIQTAKQVLGSSVAPSLEAPLQDLGIDSLGAVEFRNSLSKKLGIKLTVTTLFDYPTLSAITDHIVSTLESSVKTAGVMAQPLALASLSQDGFAVVGMACRLPRYSDSLPSYWKMLTDSTDCMSPIPFSRWDMMKYYSKDPDAPGKCYIKEGAFLNDVTTFDNSHFGMSKLEVASVDPQQRVLLQTAAQAFASGGFTRKSLTSSDTGVFIGCCNNDWMYLNNEESMTSFSGVGNASSIVSNRLSYNYALKGPSITVDTACSSSLIAMDLAYEKLLLGECSVALVGGVNLMLTPHLFIAFCKARMLSPNSRCYTFDHRADGYARGEGAACMILQPLKNAIAENRRVYAVLKGTASNHVGRSASIIAPNGPAQAAVISRALTRAGRSPTDVTFVEAHGTGTALGDPIEVSGLSSVFGRDENRTGNHPLLIGAVKTNIGHLEGAAGIASALKAVLSLYYNKLPPNINFEKHNPELSLDDFNVEFPMDTVDLQQYKSSKLAVAGVSSFGFGGANSHVVFEEYPKTSEEPQADAQIIFGGTTAGAPSKASGKKRRTAVLFTGQGSQYTGMSNTLYRTDEVFKTELDRCAVIMDRDHMKDGLLFMEVLTNAALSDQLNETRYAQPILFALGYALYKALYAQGFRATAVLGHSLGEYMAATVAGVMTLEEGLTLTAKRAAIMSDTPAGDGVMAACRASETDAVNAIQN